MQTCPIPIAKYLAFAGGVLHGFANTPTSQARQSIRAVDSPQLARMRRTPVGPERGASEPAVATHLKALAAAERAARDRGSR